MKKILLIAMCLIMIFTFSACSNTQFLSQKKVDGLMDKYAKDGKLPQMEMTLAFQNADNSDVKLKVTYDLLLDKAPITVMSFIRLLNEGRYKNVVVDEENTSSKYFSIGRYECVDQAEKEYKFAENFGTFLGEFKNNGFTPYGTVADGDDGYTKFQLFSLAMYHDAYATKGDDKAQQEEYARAYNSADGRLILAYSNDSLSYKNYAIFAQPVDYKVAIGDGEFVSTVISGPILERLCDIGYTSVTIDGATYRPLKITAAFNMVAVEGIDWTTISENYLVTAE